jgi:uncharacterized protein YcbX
LAQLRAVVHGSGSTHSISIDTELPIIMALLHQLIPRLDSSFERLLLLIYPLCLVPVVLLLWAERKHQKQLRSTPRGCKKLGIIGPSNLADEEHPKYSEPSKPWKVKALFVYPIKSCAPIELDTAGLSSTGLSWDREFCFAEYTIPTIFPPGTSDAEKKKLCWTFRTLRKTGYERMVHIRPEIWYPDADYVRINRIGDPNLHGALVINYPNIPQGVSLMRRRIITAAQFLHLLPRHNSFRVPLLPPKNHDYPIENISIWHDIPQGLNYGRHLPPDLKAYLGIPDSTPFTLFRASPISPRQVYRNAPQPGPGPDQVPYQPIIAFPDAHPIHLLNLASVRDVAARVEHEIPHLTARRFRANIIVTGPAAYDEDDWTRLHLHHHPHHHHDNYHPSSESEKQNQPISPSFPPLDFHAACHTLRCRLPNVDPDRGVRHATEPDRTLRSFRCIDRGVETKAALGLMLVSAVQGPADGDGDEVGKPRMEVRVGDGVEVVERGELVAVKF